MRSSFWIGLGVLLLAGAGDLAGQGPVLDRLPSSVLDVVPPTERVIGTPGSLTLRPGACRTDVPDGDLRRRIVDVATQEWAYFGFPVFDESLPARLAAMSNGLPGNATRPRADEALRTGPSVAGYWSVTAEGAWIVDRQNGAWNRSASVTRWLDPWSAAFISWVMCEAGLGERDRFQRAVAHHTYIDQAIRARDGRAPAAAFMAYDLGEVELIPGDLLCSGRRPAYRSIVERRRQMGSGAASHCDIVVAVDEVRDRILTIGGNVRGTVGLKLFPAERSGTGVLRPVAQPPGAGARVLFAHLRLQASPIAADALLATPTLATVQGCGGEAGPPPPHLLVAGIVRPGPVPARC